MTERKHLFTILKKDFTITATTGSGKGGQHQNKTATKVRVTHNPSGATCVCNSERSQHSNKITAFNAIQYHPKFKIWLAGEIARIDGQQTVDERVDELMEEANLAIEYGSIVNGRFIEGVIND